MGLARVGVSAASPGEALAITAVRGFGLAALPEERALPAKDIGEEGMKAVRMEMRQGIVVQSQCLGGLLALLGRASLPHQLARCLYVVASH